MLLNESHDDKQACISLARGAGHFLTSKLIGVRYHYLREKVKPGYIRLTYIPTDQQLADVLANSLVPATFDVLMKKVVVEMDK